MMKIDVEGAELGLIPSIRDTLEEHRPTVYLSTHAPHFPESERQAKMRIIMETSSIYTFCYDRSLSRIHMQELMDSAFVNEYNEILFSDEELDG